MENKEVTFKVNFNVILEQFYVARHSSGCDFIMQ